jgi:hypothetical protein
METGEAGQCLGREGCGGVNRKIVI